MGRRYYRRKRSMAGEMIRDTVEVSNRLPWWGVAIFTFILFALFYWVLPWWIHSRLDSLQNNMLGHLIEAAIRRRVHWSQYLAIVIALIGSFFTIRNFFFGQRLNRSGERNVGWFSRIFARFLD